MAGDWIKLTHSVFEAPEVLAIADRLDLPVCHVVGCLARVWSWFDQQSESGDACVTLSLLNRVLLLPGFAEMMVEVGWLEHKDGRVSIPKFERHNGKSAKKRALTRDRMREMRLRNSDANVTQSSSLREEKRRVLPTYSPSRWEGLQPAINGLKKIQTADDAAAAHDAVEGYFRSLGFKTEREVEVANRGDGRRGYVDLVAVGNGTSIAVEIDSRTAREKSLFKLRQLAVDHRLVVLRCGEDADVDGIRIVAIRKADATKNTQRIPPVNAPQAVFIAFARGIGVEPRIGESDGDFRQRVIREAESHNREAA